jgi:hypothetical protein
MKPIIFVALSLLSLLLAGPAARASIAYGSINNFDTVNDTGHVCHGFEIEIEDCRSTDITYTYNYNHYGVPKITQDDSIPAHPRCIIRWESKKNADGSWAAYTAIPSGPISPTNGHMFTNPSVNFGGEHFGAGYNKAVGAIKYNWLIDNGSGALIHGGAVQVATPQFTYFPPVAGNPAPAQVQAVIEPPEPPEVPVKEFGPAVWVKEIRTTTHNNKEIKLQQLVSDDPGDAEDKNWANGEPDEMEVEWQLLQKDFNSGDGGNNGQLVAEVEDLNDGDEVVTRRYEFFEYIGPFDDESGEAMADSVGPDDLRGEGVKEINGVNVDLSTVIVVGEFKGAQMSAVNVDAAVGLIEHVCEGKINTPYTARRVVIEGASPFTATITGALPPGMNFNTVTGILAGTPTQSGEFAFKITADDGVNPEISKNYTLLIAPAAAPLPPACLVDSTAFPVAGGTTEGDGSFVPGEHVTLVAKPNDGFFFRGWEDDGVEVGTSPVHTFTADVNHSVTAQFGPEPRLVQTAAPGSLTLSWPAAAAGWTLEESADLSPGSWTPSALVPVLNGANNEVTVPKTSAKKFFRLRAP